MTAVPRAEVGAVLLVGGEARRMGGTAKPLLTLGGRTLLTRTIDALERAGASPVVAVGPRLDEASEVVWTREDPPSGGPVAGIAAGIAQVSTEWVLVLAGDLVHPEDIVTRLIARVGGDGPSPDGSVFSADGRPQWLAGVYRTASIRAALAALGDGRDASARTLLGGLAIEWILDEDGITVDIDTPDDLARARAEHEEAS